MSNVRKLAAADRSAESADFKRLRQDHDLSITQMAEAMEVSTATIEAWERGLNSPPYVRVLEERVAEFARAFPSKQQGRNLLFGCYPLRLARELLALDVEQMAGRFGYSKSSWTKIEANFRTIPPEKLAEIEEFVRIRLAEVCNP